MNGLSRGNANTLITRDLGYCCEWFFLFHYTDTRLVCARLGISERTLRRRRAAMRRGEVTCTCAPTCIRNLLKIPAQTQLRSSNAASIAGDLGTESHTPDVSLHPNPAFPEGAK